MSEWNDAIEAAKNAIGISGQQVRLNFGELSAQEMRTAKAILSWAIYKLDSLKRPAERDGWKLVPVEPIEEMIDRACAERTKLYPAFEGQKPQPTGGEVASTIYRAMLATAPTPEAKQPMTQSPIEKAKEALRPFAETSKIFAGYPDSKQVGGFMVGSTPVFVSDYRRAREALKALEGE